MLQTAEIGSREGNKGAAWLLVPWGVNPLRPFVWGCAVGIFMRILVAGFGMEPWWNLVGVVALFAGMGVSLRKFPSARDKGAVGWVQVVAILACAWVGCLWLAANGYC